MSLASAIWTFVAWLFSAAGVGFAAAWLIQTWRMREGKELAHSLEVDTVRLRAAQEQMRASLDRERSARVASDARLIELQRDPGPLRVHAFDPLTSRSEVPLDSRLAQEAGQRLHEAQTQLTATHQHAAELERECHSLRAALSLQTERISALTEAQTTLAREHANLLAAQKLSSDAHADWEQERQSWLNERQTWQHEREAGLAERQALLDERTQLLAKTGPLFEARAKLAEETTQLAEARAQLAEEAARVSAAHAQLTIESAQLAEVRAKLAEEFARLEEERARLEAGAENLAIGAATQAPGAAPPALGADDTDREAVARREEAELAQRMAAQHLHQLEEQVARGTRLAREHRAEVAGLKSRIKDLEERLAQLWAQQNDATPAPE